MVQKEPLKKMYKFPSQKDFYVTHSSISKIVNYYEKEDTLTQFFNEWKEPFKSRFIFNSEIQPIELDTLKKEFCSIVVDKKIKNNIIHELKTLEIDEAYVYPELQYTTRKLKKIHLT